MTGTAHGIHADSIGSGPLVVLVHGTAPAVWGDVPRRLAAEGRTVVTYWRRSYPPSDPSPVSSLRQHTEDLGALIAARGGHAVVVGWSVGGVIALDLATRQPERVDGLVLLEAALHLKHRPSPAMVRAVVSARLRGKRDAPAGARRFLRWALSRRDAPDDLGRLEPRLVDACGEAIVAELALGTGERELGPRDLASITVPVRWLVGTQSRAAFRTSARRASVHAPAMTVQQVPGAGHIVQLDDPTAVVEAVVHHQRHTP